jgi:hypothetical protein
MADLIGALVGILVALVIIPLVVLVVLFALATAGIGIALSVFFTLFGIVITLLFNLAPFILVGMLIYWAFKPKSKAVSQ